MPQDLTVDKSTLVQVMAWCRQATSHYLNQFWPRSSTPYGVTRPQWVETQIPLAHLYTYMAKYQMEHYMNKAWRWSYFEQGICLFRVYALQWRQDERDGVSNNRRIDCLLNRLFRHRSEKTSKLRVTGLCEGNPPVTGGFPSQKDNNAENASIWWRHHR